MKKQNTSKASNLEGNKVVEKLRRDAGLLMKVEARTDLALIYIMRNEQCLMALLPSEVEPLCAALVEAIGYTRPI